MITIDAKGLEQLSQLLHDTTTLAEQLQKKIDEISNLELEIAIQKTKNQVS